MFKFWPKCKSEYIEGIQDKTGHHYPTYSELAEKWKLAPAIIGRRAAQEKWPEARKMFSNKVETLRLEKRPEILASESAQFDSDCLRIARAALGKIVQELKGAGPVDKTMAALEKAQKIGRLAMGEQAGPDVVQEFKIIVTSEKAKQLTESIINGKGTD